MILVTVVGGTNLVDIYRDSETNRIGPILNADTSLAVDTFNTDAFVGGWTGTIGEFQMYDRQ